MNNLIKCPEPITGITKKWKVFLAGPIQGAPDWQSKLPEIENVVYLSPRRESYPVPNFNYDEQVEWETQALRSANIVLVWIPKEDESIAGRSYAQTTRFEVGENMARGKNIILGIDETFPGRRYFEHKANEYGVLGDRVFSTLEECVKQLKDCVEVRTKNPRTYFTSDTHFSSERALELSMRPFNNVKEMDWTMIERWNKEVMPCDTVWHLGDFGDNWPLGYLSGNIKFLNGNYERDGKSTIDESLVNIVGDYATIEINGELYYLIHEPEKCKRAISEYEYSRKFKVCKIDKVFGLYGHIHGRQRIKPFGMDVGVDCSNFTPVSTNEVVFYRDAVEKGFYDENVWVQ